MTLACLEKIKATFPLEIIVVDNASNTNEIEYIKSAFPQVNFISNPSNLGFSKANNLGVKSASSDRILILNPDTIISESCIREALNLLSSEEKIGAVSVKMVDGNGEFLPESIRSFPNLKSSLFKLFGLHYLFPHSDMISRYYKGLSEDNTIDAMSGACIFFKKNVYESIGGFDERYFMYGEDIDISYQLRKNGFVAKYLDKFPIVHFKGKSSLKSNWKYQNAFYNAMKLYWDKNFNLNNLQWMLMLVSVSVFILKLLSFAKHTLKQILFPLVDFLGILFFTAAFSYLWSNYIKGDASFMPSEFYLFVLPLYTISAIISFFINKFYLVEIDLSRWFRGGIFNLVFVLIIYFLLPSDYKYSRAIILYCSMIAMIVPLVNRYFFAKINNAKIIFSNSQFIVANVFSRVENEIQDCVESFSKYKLIYNRDSYTDKILDIDFVSNENIISEIESNQFKNTIWLYSQLGNYLIQSHGKNSQGFIIASDTNFSINDLVNRFLKRFFDIVISMLILPVGFLTKHSFSFIIQSIVKVLFQKYTWISCAGYKKGIFVLSDELGDNFKRNYSLRLDVYYFFRSMFIS